MTLQAIEKRRNHAWMQRAKLLVQMLTTTAYAALGVAIGDPIIRGERFTTAHLASLVVGAICVYAALHLAPEGERNDA